MTEAGGPDQPPWQPPQYPYGGPMPPAGGYPATPRGPMPASVALAIRVSIVDLVVTTIGSVVGVATGATKFDTTVPANSNLTQDQLDSVRHAALVGGTLIAIGLLVFWIVCIVKMRRGRPWARVVTLIFGSLQMLYLLSAFSRSVPILMRAFALVIGVLAVALVVQLSRKESAAWFKRPRPDGFPGA